jgi:beta-glucosidase
VVYTEGIFVGYRHYDQKKIEPAFSFGHGLSYTHFEIKNVTVSSDKLAPGDSATVSAKITNTGDRNGSEVIQLYVTDPISTLSRPDKELKAFQKVNLQPGESKQIRLSIGMRALAAFDERDNGWLAEAGQFELRIATSADHVVAKLPITLTADWFESVSPKGVN